MFSTFSNLSPGEIDYITTSCERNCRLDGRPALGLRPYSLDINVIPTANGSARIRIETANILAVLKLDIGDVTPAHVPSDLIRTSVDIKNAPHADKNALSLLATSLSAEIKSVLVASALVTNNLLVIIPGEKAWFLSADITVFSHCGNIFDYSLTAIRAALATTTIPALRVIRKKDSNHKISEQSLELIPGQTVPLGAWDKFFPLPLSLCILNDTIIIDPTDYEESCVGSRYLVGFDRDGNVLSHAKVGVTGCSPQLYMQSLNVAQSLGDVVYEYYLQTLTRAVEVDEKMSKLMNILYKKVGPNAPIPKDTEIYDRVIHKNQHHEDKLLDDIGSDSE